MSHQTKLFGLHALAGQIEAERIKLLPGPPKPDSASFIELERKIDSWEKTIRGVQRDLKSKSHFNHMVYNQNRFGPGSYSAKQQLNSREENVGQLADALAEVAARLLDLTDKLYGGPNGVVRGLEGIKHALKNHMKQVKASEEALTAPLPHNLQNTVREVQVRAPQPMDKPMPPGPGVIDIFTLILAYFVLIKSLNKKD